VHGGEYVVVAEPNQLEWVRKEVSTVFEIRTQMFGPDEAKGGKQEVPILGIIVEWHDAGVTYEADPRHAEKLIQEFKLENGKGSSTQERRMKRKETRQNKLKSREKERPSTGHWRRD
jgi:hypothetical protein